MRARARTTHGFTLIEVMITVAILSILAAIAIPIYKDYVIRSTVPEATTRLTEARTKMEQYFLDNRNYGTGGNCPTTNPPVIPVTTAQSDSFSYACALLTGADGLPGYRITATGYSNKPSNGFIFDIDQASVQRTLGVPTSWVSAAPALPVNRWIKIKGG